MLFITKGLGVGTQEHSASNRFVELIIVGKFGLVGVFNTLIDFTIYNLLSSNGLTLVESNLVSTTVAMIFSFFANKRLVFKKAGGNLFREVALFWLVSAFGVYVLQTGVIKILTDVWPSPLNQLVAFAHTSGVTGHDAFIIKNSAKLIGTIVSLTWNFFMYKKVVFN
jgi:putative flippase GtrA